MGNRSGNKRKSKYNVTETLSPRSFPKEYEEITTELYNDACRGSEKHWSKITSEKDFRDDSELRNDFLSSAHKGMRNAQEKIICILKDNKTTSYAEEILYRGISDTIAWQLIGLQICYARRFYKGHNQPNIHECNFDSVVLAAKQYNEERPNSISVISDLTSFIQVGDLLSCDPETGLSICEVKTGKMNHKVANFMNFYLEHQCDRSLYYFAQQEGKPALKQLDRMMRQASRMAHVSTIMNKGIGTDPDTGEKIHIPEPYIMIDSWDEELCSTLEDSDKKGWAINVIDNCLFLGCYSKPEMIHAGHAVFNSWFDNCGGIDESPRIRLIDSMQIPLALPVFNLPIPDKFKFDILFGRKHVCLGLSIDNLLNECQKIGLSVRSATNKEQGRLDNTGNRPYRHNGKGIFIGDGKNEIALMDGIFLRSFFHGQKPVSFISQVLKNQTNDT